MGITDSHGIPIAISLCSASPHEVTLIEETLEQRFVSTLPKRLIGDKAYDSDPHDKKLAKRGIELIAPHKMNRKKPKTQDGRKLRRYKRRWKVERLFAWLFNFRRIVVRYERKIANYAAFVQLACLKIYLSNFEIASRLFLRRYGNGR